MSQEWAEEALRRVESDERIGRALKGLDISLLTTIDGGPKDTYGFMYVEFSSGGLQDYRVGHDIAAVSKGIENPTFHVSGSYETFHLIQVGTLGEKIALLTGKLHLKGSLVKALRHMRALETVTKVLREIPITAA